MKHFFIRKILEQLLLAVLYAVVSAADVLKTDSIIEMEVFMHRLKFTLWLLMGLFLFSSRVSIAQDKSYTEGTVWSVSLIKVKPGMFDTYMSELLPQRKKLYDEAKKAGLVVSEKILAGSSSGRDDWDVMLMTEYKNWAALDGLSDKFDVIARKVIGSDETQVKTMVKRTSARDYW